MDQFNQLYLAYLTFFLGALSPGPSNLTVMNVAMSSGRHDALSLATGVVTGTMTWAVLASTGLATLLIAHNEAISTVRVIGGLYLLYLALSFARAAWRPRSEHAVEGITDQRSTFKALYVRGLLLHLVNPKAILSWVATMSLGLQRGAPAYAPFLILAGCVLIAILIYGCYATLFSLPSVSWAYRRAQFWINCALTVFFAMAAGTLLLG